MKKIYLIRKNKEEFKRKMYYQTHKKQSQKININLKHKIKNKLTVKITQFKEETTNKIIRILKCKITVNKQI